MGNVIMGFLFSILEHNGAIRNAIKPVFSKIQPTENFIVTSRIVYRH